MDIAFKIFGWIFNNIIMFDVIMTSLFAGGMGVAIIAMIFQDWEYQKVHPVFHIIAFAIAFGMALKGLLKAKNTKKGFWIISGLAIFYWTLMVGVVFFTGEADIIWSIFGCAIALIIVFVLHYNSYIKMDENGTFDRKDNDDYNYKTDDKNEDDNDDEEDKQDYYN